MAVLGSTLRTGLVGRPSLRREFKGMGSERLGEVENALSDIDPKRFRSLYRQRAQQILENDNAAQPVAARMQIEEQMKSPNLTGSQRDILSDKLRRNEGGWGSAAARNDPFRWGSAAQTQFGSLYRR